MKVCGGVDDTPVSGGKGVADAVEPGFLNCDDVPVFWSGAGEYVLLRYSRFVHVLLPNSQAGGLLW